MILRIELLAKASITGTGGRVLVGATTWKRVTVDTATRIKIDLLHVCFLAFLAFGLKHLHTDPKEYDEAYNTCNDRNPSDGAGR